MFVTNWKKIWDLANKEDIPVDEAFAKFKQHVKFGINIDDFDFDFRKAHADWIMLSEDQQKKVLEEGRIHNLYNYFKRVKEYNAK